METVSTEDIVSCLLTLGYDQVDTLLVSLINGKLSLEGDFEIVDEHCSNIFQKYVETNDIIFKLKKNVNLDINISEDKEKPLTLRQFFSKKKKLLEFLNNIDLERLVYQKIKMIGVANVNKYREIFSNKEKELLPIAPKSKNKGRVK